MDKAFYRNRLTFNSFYRSGNVFLYMLSWRMVNYNIGTQHDPSLFLDLDVKNVVMFRNPYDCISSVIIKRKVDAENAGESFFDFEDIDDYIFSAAQEYMSYVEAAEKSFNNIYVGNFERMIQDPIGEIKNICKFFNLTVNKDFNSSLEEVYSDIEKEMFENVGPAGAINLMTSHDGHLPREKSKDRLYVEECVKKSSILKQCYDLYKNIKYTV